MKQNAIDAASALYNGVPFKKGSIQVKIEKVNNCKKAEMYLFNNLIAIYFCGVLQITLCGY